MIYFKACPKCHGDLTINRDGYGAFVSCLQCGFMRDIDVKPVLARAPVVSRSSYADEEQLAKAA